MKIIISGGGNVGSMLAKRLIADEHNVTIIEKNNSFIKHLKNSLDALVIHGDGTNVETLKEAGIHNADIFLAVTNNDHANLISCHLAKILGSNQLFVIGKVEDIAPLFGGPSITPKNFGVDMLIDPGSLSLTKLELLLKYPSIVEMVNYGEKQFQLASIRVTDESPLANKTLQKIPSIIKILDKIKITAIARGNDTIIPNGNTQILPNDLIYATGKTTDIKKLLENGFTPGNKSKRLIIVGGNTRGAEIAEYFSEKGKKVTIIDKDIRRCVALSKQLSKPLIIHGSVTYEDTTQEADLTGACVIAASDDDEYNVLSAVSAKKAGAIKTICMVRNSEIVPMATSMPDIDTIFSPHALAVGEILHICRQDNIISAAFLSEINATTIEFTITTNSPVHNHSLNTITFPEGMVIGAVERAGNLFIPAGKDILLAGDKITVFTLPETAKQLKKELVKKHFGKLK